MDPVAFLTNKLKGLAKWKEDIMMGMPYWHEHKNPTRQNPIEVLKRLQREAFSDIMKLRDRQDKVERMLSFYKSTKGSPFQEASTRVKGEVDVAGALLFLDTTDQPGANALNRAGIRTGITSRFTFETTIREKDNLAVEFLAKQNDQGFGDVIGSPLSLTKVKYSTNFSDWCSAVVIPMGAQCKDVAADTNALHQELSMTNISSFGSPILGQCHNAAAAGLVVERSNVTAALAEIVSEVGLQQQDLDSVDKRRSFSTFGQVICQISKGTKLTLMGIHQKLSRPCQQQIRMPRLTVPIGSFRHQTVVSPNASSSSSGGTSPLDVITRSNAAVGGSVVAMVESELDESTRIGGWLEMQNSSSQRCLGWGVSVSDIPDDEAVGWGLSLSGGGNKYLVTGGEVEGHHQSSWSSGWDNPHLKVEAFLRLSMMVGGGSSSNRRMSLQPGLVYVMDGTTRVPAVMFRSSCSL